MNKKSLEIYDDPLFFDNYINLRNKENNYNDLIEQPIIFDLIGSVKNKSVLDIGCGYGAMTIKIAKAGAEKVIGVDVSEKMIKKANAENLHEKIQYKIISAEKINTIEDKFDIVVSCLAIHYIENFKELFSNIASLIKSGGKFIFSMEHPMYTASKFPQQWINDTNTNFSTAFITDHYGEEGIRSIEWLGKKVIKYHHKTETVINSLINSGFVIEKIIEPTPTKEMIERIPKTSHELHRPAYLIVKCNKT